MPKHALKGSERTPLPGARVIGAADPAERLEVSLVLRRRAGQAFRRNVSKCTAGEKQGERARRSDFAQKFGAAPKDVQAVEKFSEKYGLVVVQKDAARRTMIVAGTVAQFNKAFDVELQQFEHAGGSYRGRTGSVHLPSELKGVVEAVLGLDNRPQARTRFRVRPAIGNLLSSASSSSYSPLELAALYNFPTGTGKGECIGIIELGGGYRTDDIENYFAKLKLSLPAISAMSVDHGRNNPTGDSNGPDGEVVLDIEVAGAIAPQARIVVYFAPNTDAGFLDAVTTAIHDASNKPSVISISWGGPETSWTKQSMTAFDQAFQDAATLGITVFVASGDSGSSDGVDDGKNHVDFPASSPFALACGGTSLQAANGKILREVVWNDGPSDGATGGGVSSIFPRPPWQQGLQLTDAHQLKGELPRRGIPDVSGNADPRTGYEVRIDGSDTVIGGTSAVAPLWAGLIARINGMREKPAGYLNPSLYKHPQALNDITQGNNGSYSAAQGWDACTGIGSPNGVKLAALLPVGAQQKIKA